jgi:hypothetical protein
MLNDVELPVKFPVRLAPKIDKNHICTWFVFTIREYSMFAYSKQAKIWSFVNSTVIMGYPSLYLHHLTISPASPDRLLRSPSAVRDLPKMAL